MARKRKASRRKIKKSPVFGLFLLGILLCASMAATIYLIFLRPGTHTQEEIQPVSPVTQAEKKNNPSPNNVKEKSQQPPAPTPVSLENQPSNVTATASEVEEEELIDETIEIKAAEAHESKKDTKNEKEPHRDPQQEVAGPQLAIIIDDLGDKKRMGEKFTNLDFNLSFSVLPHSTYGKQLAKKAHEKGRDIRHLEESIRCT